MNTDSNLFGVDPINRHTDRGRADFDIRHNWQFSAIYRLPKPFTGRALGAMFNGWRASGILAMQSGVPFTPTLKTNRSRSGVNAGGSVSGSDQRLL